jgi:hypothetical protein
VAENFFLTMTEQPTLMAAPTAIHIDEEWYIGKGLKQAKLKKNNFTKLFCN